MQITELSGAESVIHFSHGALNWISQSHGVHALEVGETETFHLNVDGCMYFDTDGLLIAASTGAAGADNARHAHGARQPGKVMQA